MRSFQPTFETFVRTRTNLVAYRLCLTRARAETVPGSVLLLSGGPGTGKTHLLQATAHAASLWPTPGTVLLTTARSMCEELVRALRLGVEDSTLDSASSGGDASRTYEQLQILLIDDLQDLVGKPGTQQQFALMLTRAATAGTRVICASGVAPEALPELRCVLSAERLYGSIELASLPPYELRRIVRHVAACRGVPLAGTTVAQVAENCGGDIRRALGIVAQLDAAARLGTPEAVAQAMRRLGHRSDAGVTSGTSH